MTEQKLYPFNSGQPTGPDVDLLMKSWPELNVGDRITYEDITAATGIEYKTQRWKTVTDAWRRRLLEKSIVVDCETGSAFYVASTDQITGKSHAAITHIKRTAKKQRRRLSMAKADNEAQASTITHQGRLFQAIERDAQKARMNLLPSTKPMALPKAQ